MGQKMRGIYINEKTGTWEVDKWWEGTRLRQRGFFNFAEAESWLIFQLGELRAAKTYGQPAVRTFNDAAAHYLVTQKEKKSIVTETYLLKAVMPTIGHLALNQVHDGTLLPFVRARLSAGRSHKTINLSLGIVRRILNLAAGTWRDNFGNTWMTIAPKLTLLPLLGHQREPRPISWTDQRKLIALLPKHLAQMAIFTLNTGVRDDVVCNLRWSWEIKIPEIGASVFDVPREHVKGGKRSRIVVCNSVAQSIVEDVRGQHHDFVFVYRRERIKNINQAPAMPYRPIQTMNNTAWQNARKSAALGDLHVHDLRHTLGMRLREAGVSESTAADVLWHSVKTMTQHYSMAQIAELHAALEKIAADSGRWNKTLSTLRQEQAERMLRQANPPKIPVGQTA